MQSVVGLLLALATHQPAAPPENIGYLVRHVRSSEGTWHQVSDVYRPREGDLVFYNDHSVKWGFLYKLVGSDAPFHAGLVFNRPDGQIAIVEAGPNDTLKCRVLDLRERLHSWEHTLQIRPCKLELPPDRSFALTEWAMSQDQKRYALGRLLLQATPFRARGPLRRELFGATYIDRSSYLCAELAVCGSVVAGILNERVHKANTIYPRDIIYDDVHDLSQQYDEARVWIREPILRDSR